MSDDFNEADFREIEQHREANVGWFGTDAASTPTDPQDETDWYGEAREFLADAVDRLRPESVDPEGALRAAEEAIARIKARL